MSAINLQNSHWCINCDTIYDGSLHSNCPKCTSDFYLRLEKVIQAAIDNKLMHTPAKEFSK